MSENKGNFLFTMLSMISTTETEQEIVDRVIKALTEYRDNGYIKEKNLLLLL